jgi:Rrf2 family protein
MLSRTAGYAVRAVIVLARAHGERAVSAEEIASILGAPHNYLSKTLNALARRGVLTSVRGPGGGFALAVAPDVLTVADIVEVFGDATVHGPRCVLRDSECDPVHPCAAHQRWTELTLDAREPLLRTAISELCGVNRPAVAAARS